MDITEHIKKPTYVAKPDFQTGKGDSSMPYHFNCSSCGSPVEISMERQIANNWKGKTDEIKDDDLNQLKEYYSIGLSGKSHEGGFPVFDKISCSNCHKKYITYCRVLEHSHSVYSVQVQGVIKI